MAYSTLPLVTSLVQLRPLPVQKSNLSADFDDEMLSFMCYFTLSQSFCKKLKINSQIITVMHYFIGNTNLFILPTLQYDMPLW